MAGNDGGYSDDITDQSCFMNGSSDATNGKESQEDRSSGSHDRKLFVGGLAWETTDKELREYFSKFGEIENINLKTDPNSGRSRGFAFLLFAKAESLDKITAAGDHVIQGKKVDPKKAKARKGKIFVGGLPTDISDDEVKTFFGQFGKIVETEMPFDKMKNQRKGFCFITYETEQIVNEILRNPKQVINGKEVDVKKATPRPADGMGNMRGGMGMMRGRGRGRGGFGGPQGGWGGPGYGGGYGYDQSGYGYDGSYEGGYDYSYGYGNEGYGGYDYGYGAQSHEFDQLDYSSAVTIEKSNMVAAGNMKFTVATYVDFKFSAAAVLDLLNVTKEDSAIPAIPTSIRRAAILYQLIKAWEKYVPLPRFHVNSQAILVLLESNKEVVVPNDKTKGTNRINLTNYHGQNSLYSDVPCNENQ